MLFPDNAKQIISETFYDKEVSVLTKSETFDAEGGAVKSSTTTVESTFLGNVRFVNYGEKQDEKGLLKDIDIQITCPTETNVALDAILEYQGDKFVVISVEPYDSHKLISARKWQGQ